MQLLLLPTAVVAVTSDVVIAATVVTTAVVTTAVVSPEGTDAAVV